MTSGGVSDAVSSRGRIRLEPCERRLRAYLHGALVLDTVAGRYVWEVPYYPSYYVPADDVRARLVPTGETRHSPSRGEGIVHDIVTAHGTAPAAALRYPNSPLAELRQLVKVGFDEPLQWLEEDEAVYTHPRDPYTRIDVLASSRRVRIEVDGVTVAESGSPRILFETGLPPRFYLPLPDVRMDLLEPSPTRSHCPYKGAADYWHLLLDGIRHDDAAWSYRAPFPEAQRVAGLVCFYNERVDLFLDGVRQPRPQTKFS